MREMQNFDIFYLLDKARKYVKECEKNLGEIRIEYIRKWLKLAISFLDVLEEILKEKEEGE